MGEALDGRSVVAGTGFMDRGSDLVKEPGCGLDTGSGFVIAGVEGGKVFEVASHIFLIEGLG